MPAVVIAPSMLSSDFARLADEAKEIIEKGADWLHMDVMDGHFVPNLTLGAPIVKSLRAHTDAFLDCHLMVSDPAKWVQDFATAGASQVTFHIEATSDPVGLAKAIRKLGMRAGVAVKPGTAVDTVEGMLDEVDMVLIMTVEPGFGGQKFMEDMMGKVKRVRELRPELDIQVDGGIDAKTIVSAAEAGANVFVAGTAIFKAEDRKETMQVMKQAANVATQQ